MKIGIVVYSNTGHTLSVAMKLRERLSADGHAVALQEIETAGPVRPGAESAEFKSKPAIDAYDVLMFGSPVWGGKPAAPVMSYLEQSPSLQGKEVACLVTGFFPAAGWGRNQTLARMQEICEAKGATVRGSGSVGWFSLARRRQISRVVDSLARCLGP